MEFAKNSFELVRSAVILIIGAYIAIAVAQTLFPTIQEDIVKIPFFKNFINLLNRDWAPENGAEYAISECVRICNETKADKVNLKNGPCLASPIEKFPNWVCDVAHNPRTVGDDLAKNRCEAYRTGAAKYYVEVDEDCKLIRTG